MWRFLYTHRTHGYQSSGTLRFSLLSDALRQQATRSFTTTRALLCRAGSGKSRSSANSAVEAPPTEEVWELWNEGNLYRLTLAQLQAFLVRNGVTVDSEWKKTALVKQVEGILKADNPSAVAAAKSPAGKEPTASNSTEGGVDAVADGSSWAMEREYAFHGANTISELGFPEAAGEFVDVQQAGLYSSSDGAHLAAMVPRAFQLIHQDFTPDMLISRINTTAFPSGNAESTAFTVLPSHAKTANRARFQKALQWCVANVWNLNLEGEVHVNFGKLLLWHQPPPLNGEGKDLALSLASSPLRPRHLSKASQMSLWSAQQLMQGPELPYSWLNVVHASSEADLAAHCERVGYEAVTSVPQADTSKCVTYRCNVRRQMDFLEGEVRQVSPESPLEMVSLNAAWERFLVTYHLRTTMPDARIQLRARPALKKKTLEQFQDLVILRPAKDLSVATVESAVPPELGEVTFAVQRQTRSWRRPSNTPQTMLQLNSHITRVALVKNKLGVFETTLREPRWEAELIVVVPPQHTRLDLNTLSEEIWAEMTTLCEVLETSTKAYGCTPVL